MVINYFSVYLNQLEQKYICKYKQIFLILQTIVIHFLRLSSYSFIRIIIIFLHTHHVFPPITIDIILFYVAKHNKKFVNQHKLQQ